MTLEKLFNLTPLPTVHPVRERLTTDGVLRGGVNPKMLERARRGDPAAQEALVARMAPGLLRLASRLGLQPHDAEELVGMALYRGLTRLRRLRSDHAVSTWFFRIAINLWRDWLRSAARPEVTVEDLSTVEAPPGDAPEGPIRIAELRERVQGALRCLPPMQRVAMALHVDEELSIAEIAAVLESTPERVKVNLHHARKRLRELLPDLCRTPSSSREEATANRQGLTSKGRASEC